MALNSLNNTLIFCCYSLLSLLLLLNLHNSFFWDTVLYASQHGNFYLRTHFSKLLVPDEMDCGSIPAFGMYIGLVWRLFGRTLAVSHLAMLPFVIGFVWQLQRFSGKFLAKEFIGFAMILLLSDSTILSQVTLVSPDLPFLFFFFLGANAALENKKFALTLSIVFLFLINTRGTLAASCILLIDLYRNVRFRDKWRLIFISLSKRSLVYLPGLILFIAFYSFHYLQKDWAFRHEDSPWKIPMQYGIKDLLFNAVLIVWRMLDYGKIAVWLILFAFAVKFRHGILKLKNISFLIFLIIVIFFMMHLSLLPTNLFAHRYFMPFNLCFGTLCAAVLFSDLVQRKWKFPIALVWLCALLSGNLWIYPQKTSQGWDSTLAHLPYYELRHQAISYLEEQHIDLNQVQSFFPNVAVIDKIDLNNDQRHFTDFDGKSEYVFFSNIFNVKDEDQDFIAVNYKVIRRFENHRIYVSIYKRRYP